MQTWTADNIRSACRCAATAAAAGGDWAAIRLAAEYAEHAERFLAARNVAAARLYARQALRAAGVLDRAAAIYREAV